MSINLINKSNTVFNSIKLQPEFLYVSASSDCNFLSNLDIQPTAGQILPGVYGDIKESNLKIRNNRLYQVNSKFYDSSENTIEKISSVKNSIEDLEETFDTEYNSLLENYPDNDNILNTFATISKGVKFNFNKSIAESKGISKVSDSFSFKTERIDHQYLIDSTYFYKKNAIKNSFKYYKENIAQNNFLDLEWGFTNYNSLNFFNIDDTFNSNFLNNVTHKNCLIYPNISENNKQVYDITNIEDISFSFYINPRKKSKSQYHYNPGCIINVPGIISVFIVKGTSVDENNLTNGYRLFVQTGDSTYENINSNFLNLSNLSSQSNNLNYLSKDNILKYNNWHNVVLSLRKNSVDENSGYNLSLCVDGEFVESVFGAIEIENFIGNSFITIGNKINLNRNQISDFVLHAFSKDKDALDDNEGPYVKKHIILGDQISSVINTPSSSGVTYNFLNSLNSVDSDYISDNTSMALQAELCDIRIYNSFIDSDKSKEIYAHAVEDIDSEIENYNLSFYLPVYLKSQNVRKKGLINLSAPYKKTYITTEEFPIQGGAAIGTREVTNFANVDENLSGSYPVEGLPQEEWPVSESDFRVKTENISYNFPINPYFHNFTGGTDVSVEHFLREFVSNTQPNIVIGNNIKEDRYQDCFLVRTSYLVGDNSSTLNNIAKHGGSSDDLLASIYSEEILTESAINNVSVNYQNDNIIYRNYMILPNDNGIQEQKYSNKIFKYTESDYTDIHKNSVGEVFYSFVSFENIEKTLSRRNSFIQSHLVIEDYFDRSNNRILDAEDRKKCKFDNSEINEFILGVNTVDIVFNNNPLELNKLSFVETPDKLKNISLVNFNNDKDILYIHDEDVNSVANISVWRNNSIDGKKSELIGSSAGCYNTLSNPAQRSYYSSYVNALSQSEIFDLKPLEDNNNVSYKKITMPLWKTNNKEHENVVNMFCISTQLFNNSIERETLVIKDVDLPLSCGLGLSFKDTKLGTLYRSDCLTKHAEWCSFGNVIYKEGSINTAHVGAYNFGKTNFQIMTKNNYFLNTFEINMPAFNGETNLSRNKSYIENIRVDNSAFNSDEDFVYITDIDLHDENLNKVASIKLTQPFAKKNSDNALFRVKMDF